MTRQTGRYSTSSTTFGELGLVSIGGAIVFVGRIVARPWWQEPVEPVTWGEAVLHGPHVWNFPKSTRGGTAAPRRPTKTGDRWPAKLAFAKGPGADRYGRKRTAVVGLRRRATARGGCRALERTIAALEPYLMQIQAGRVRVRPCVRPPIMVADGWPFKPNCLAACGCDSTAQCGAAAKTQRPSVWGWPVICNGNPDTRWGRQRTPLALAVAGLLGGKWTSNRYF